MNRHIREIHFTSGTPLQEVIENNSLRDKLWQRFREEKRWLSGSPNDGKCPSCKINDALLQAYGESFTCDCGGSVVHIQERGSKQERTSRITETYEDMFSGRTHTRDWQLVYFLRELEKVEDLRESYNVNDSDVAGVMHALGFEPCRNTVSIRENQLIEDKRKRIEREFDNNKSEITPEAIRKAYYSF